MELSGVASWVWLTLTAALGAAAVSSVQLVADRASRRPTTAALRERSSCPECSTRLEARDLVPILSFALLLGRCRSCRAPIPRRHLAGEVAGAAAWALTATQVGVSWWLPPLLLAPLALVVPMLRPARPAWWLSALLTATGAALLSLGLGGALSADWTVYVAAGLLGTAAMLAALAVVSLGGSEPAPEHATI